MCFNAAHISNFTQYPRMQTETGWWDAGMVMCLSQGADLHMAQLIPLPLTLSFQSIQTDFTFLVPAHLGSPR